MRFITESDVEIQSYRQKSPGRYLVEDDGVVIVRKSPTGKGYYTELFEFCEEGLWKPAWDGGRFVFYSEEEFSKLASGGGSTKSRAPANSAKNPSPGLAGLGEAKHTFDAESLERLLHNNRIQFDDTLKQGDVVHITLLIVDRLEPEGKGYRLRGKTNFRIGGYKQSDFPYQFLRFGSDVKPVLSQLKLPCFVSFKGRYDGLEQSGLAGIRFKDCELLEFGARSSAMRAVVPKAE